jgi:MoaA/NifB/PqqE/SkfB family radical SAM enzyme
MNSPYSPLKIFHHREWIKTMQAGGTPVPIFVQLIPTNRCNQSCIHCAYRTEGYSSNQLFNVQDELSWEKLREVVLDCKEMGVKAIELTGGGEPLLHPYFLRLCTLILDEGIDLGLVTNGAIFTEAHASVLHKASWVRFSIDAGQESTYRIIRSANGHAYHNARNAIKMLKSFSSNPIVGVSFVVTKENWCELEEAANKAYQDGADNFRISAVFQNEGADYFKIFEQAIHAICRKLVDKYRGTPFHIFDLFSNRIDDLRQGRPDYKFCGFQQTQTYIGADYNVYRCCNLAYNKQGLLGSIREQKFSALWKTLDFTIFNAHTCSRCMFNEKNQTIAYALETDPLHVNFV